jgi:TP901 family phage tail tape measure protein
MANTYTRRINLYINGKEVKNEIASIKAEMNKLVSQQARMTIGSQEYVKTTNEIKNLKAIIQQHNNDLKTTTGTWEKLGKMGDNFNRYFSLFAAFGAAIGGLLYSGKQAISTFAEFDDKVGDVMKTTGLAKEQVYAMNEELKKLNTRSSQLELMDLGRIAGKLGIRGEKDLMGFIRAADKINVALKEDLGGNTEESIRQIGKLVDIFKVKDKFGIEDSLLKVGSSINALGASSTANEQYMVEFTKRVGGIAPQAGISIQNVLGLAATLDNLGQTSEVSSTVFSGVISGMYKHTAAFAKAANIDLKTFTNLLKTDGNEAFIRLMQGLKGNSGGMDELTVRMGDLGLEGKRAIAVLGVLANNTDLIRKQQALSNKEFALGTSLTNEFNIKNETAQAKLDKASKALSNMTIELGQKLMPVLRVSTSGFSYFVKSVSVLTDFTIKHSGALLTVTAAILSYTAAAKIEAFFTEKASIAQAQKLIAIKANIAATEATAVATALTTTATNAQALADNASLASKKLTIRAIEAQRFAQYPLVESLTLNRMATEAQTGADKAAVGAARLKIVATESKVVADNAAAKANALNTTATEAQIVADKAASRTTIFSTITTKAGELAKKSATAATLLFSAAKALLTGNITRASAAMRLFNTTVGMSPLGVLTAVAAVAVGAFLILKDGISETAKAASELFSSLVKQRGEMNNLFDIVKKTGEGTAERAEGIKKINEVFGQYLPKLLDEKASLIEIKRAQLDANTALRESIALKSKDKAIQGILEKSADKQKENFERLVEIARKSKGEAAAGLFSSELSDLIDFGRNNEYEKTLEKFNVLKVKYGLHVKDWGDVIKVSATDAFGSIMNAVDKEKDELEKLDAFYASFMGKRIKDLSVEEQIAELRTAQSRAETKETKKDIQAQIDILEKRNNVKAGKPKDSKEYTFTPETTDKKKYSLNNDLEYLREKGILNNQFAKGEIASKEKLEDELLALEIKFLDKQLKSGKYAGEQLASLQSDLMDKQIKQTEEKLKASQFMKEAAGVSELEKENLRYTEELANFDKYVGNKKKMTKLEHDALAGIKAEHLKKLGEINAKSLLKEIEIQQKAADDQLNELKIKHAEELNSITSFEQAKELLIATLSEKQLQKIKTLDQAKKALEKQMQDEETKLQIDHLKKLENQLNAKLGTSLSKPIEFDIVDLNGDEIKLDTEALTEMHKALSDLMGLAANEGIDLSNKVLSDEEKQVLLDKIAEVKKALGGLTTSAVDGAGEEAAAKAAKADAFHQKQTDILGFSPDDWESLYANLEKGKIGINEITMATNVLMDAWKTYNDFVTASENRELKTKEKTSNEKKKKLQEQLDAGLISQEAYNIQVKALDADLDAKKEELANKQAKRDGALAIASIIQNTAAAIMQLWVKPGFPAAIPLSILVGGIGAFQLATVAATMSGAEEGGYLDVTRSQDGKRYRAKNNPGKRGFVDSPTVITGENGREYIAPAEAVNNPTIRPVLDILEMARQNKGLASLNFAKAYASTSLSNRGSMSGRESGGSIIDNKSIASTPLFSSDPELTKALIKMTSVVENLQKKLDDPIKTYITVHGKNGLAEKMQEYTNLKNNASL